MLIESEQSEAGTVLYFPKFQIGQKIIHLLFQYRGVIIGLDHHFRGTEDWYVQMSRFHARPAKDRPWYHVLVHNSKFTTYIAEVNMTPDPSEDSITHPLLGQYFSSFEHGRYKRF